LVQPSPKPVLVRVFRAEERQKFLRLCPQRSRSRGRSRTLTPPSASSEAARPPLGKTSPTRGLTSPSQLCGLQLHQGRLLLCLEEPLHQQHQLHGGKRRLRRTLTWRTSGQSSPHPWSTCQEAAAACAQPRERQASQTRHSQKTKKQTKKGTTRGIGVRHCRPCRLERSVWTLLITAPVRFQRTGSANSIRIRNAFELPWNGSLFPLGTAEPPHRHLPQ